MIVPGSVADWTMFAGLLGSLSGLAAFGERLILGETSAEPPGYAVGCEESVRPAA
jgi:hypothetical protein